MRGFFRTWRECFGEEPWFDLFFLYVVATDTTLIFFC